MLEALRDRLLRTPTLYLDEMAIVLWDDIAFLATKSSTSHALSSKGWSKKTACVKTRERDLDLREEHLYCSQEASGRVNFDFI
jgi:hypothetical protein